MAQNAFNLTAQINLQGPSNLRTIVADIRRQIGTINVDINPRINTAVNRNIRDLNRAFRDFNTTLAITQANAATATRSLQTLAQAINTVGNRSAQQNLNNAARAAQNLANQANNTAQGANAAATGMEQFGRQSALAIRRFAAFSVVTSAVYGLINALKSGTDAFIDFDKEFIRLRQVSDSGSASLNLLAKTITTLSTNLGVSSKELTTVSVTLAQAGLSIRDTEKALQALARSALAPSFDNLNDTVEGSIALMRQFAISSDQLESALGSVNAVAAAFAVEAGDLIAAIQRTGGVFATASKGVSEGTDALNEFLAIFTSIRQTTRESAETIATGLRTIFTRIQRGSTIDALKEYGIALTDLEGKFVGPFEAVRRLSEGLSRLDPRDTRFSSIVEELGGFRQIGKVIPLIQQFAVAQQALKVAQQGSDSLAKDSATAQLALANQIAKVREEFLALIRSIGQSEGFRSFISLALDLTSGLIKLADAAKVVLPALTALATIRGVSALTQFGAGFAGAFSAAGGARGLGQRLGGGRRFASGGLVPGSGNQDSINAKLTPGEFVLKKSVVQDIGVGNLRSLNAGGIVQKFAKAGKVEEPSKFQKLRREREEVRRRTKEVGYNRIFGLVAMQSGLANNKIAKAFNYNQLTPQTKTPVKIQARTLTQQYTDQIKTDIENNFLRGFRAAVSVSAKKLGKKAELNVNTDTTFLNNVIKGDKTGFASLVGSGLEAVLSSVNGQFVQKTEKTKSLDFPFGLGQASQLFGLAGNIPSDVTRTIGGYGKSIQQMLLQIERFIAAEGTGEIQALRNVSASNNTVSKVEALLRRNPALSPQVNQILQNNALPNYVIKGGQLLPNPKLSKFLGKKQTAIQQLNDLVSKNAFGGKTQTALALLTPGEAVLDPVAAKSIGYAKLSKMNYADKFAGGGSVGIVPGTGNGDTFGPIPLPVGSFVLRKKATKALGLNRGGIVQKFAAGGNVESNEGFKFTDLFSTIGLVVGGLAGLSAVVVGLRNNFDRVSTNVRTFGQNLVGANRGLGSGGSAARAAYREARASGLDKNAAKAQVRGGRLGRFLQSPAAYLALAAGGTAIEGIAQSLGGEKTAAGTYTSSIGGSILNYGAIGATIGSVIPGVGTALGALAGAAYGLVDGLNAGTKAIEANTKAQMEAEAEEIRNEQLKRAQKEAEEKARQLTESLQKLQLVTINLADSYNRADAYLNRFGANLEEIASMNVGRLSDLGGQGRVAQTSRADEQVLQNLSAYTAAEVSSVARRVGGLAGGGVGGRDLAQTIRAQQIIQQQLPAILRTTEAEDVSGVIRELKGLLSNQLGEPISGPLKTIIEEIDETLGKRLLQRTGEGANLNEIADNIEKIIGPVAESAQKVATNLLNQFNNALDETIKLQNEWIAATEQANELTRRASQVRLQAELDLKNALGSSVSLSEANAPFNQNIRQLTSGLIRGGTTDPTLIGQRLDQLRQENVGIENRIEQLKGGIGGDGVGGNIEAIRAQQEALARNKVAINEGTKALEELGNNGIRASNALAQLQKEQAQAKGFGTLVRGLATANPQDLLEFNRQAGAFGLGRRALAAGRGREVFSDARFRQDFFAGLDRFKDVLDPQIFANVVRAATIASFEASGYSADTFIPELGKTVRELADLEAGRANQEDPTVKAFKEAIAAQQEALKQLQKDSVESGNLIKNQIQLVFDNLKNTFPQIVREAFEAVRKDAAAIMAVRAEQNPALRSKGGIVYASQGTLVGKNTFKPRGKDTVPAMTTSGQPYMLEPGEMVINRDATNQYYDLLKSINNGDNVSQSLGTMYARDGGTIQETRAKRREAYEARKEEARQRFLQQRPGLARVLESRRRRNENNPVLEAARESVRLRGGPRSQLEEAREEARSRTRPRTQQEYELDRGQKLFAKFFASTDGYDSYYGELQAENKSDIVYNDLKANGRIPFGYSSLSLEDKSLADLAIDKFISDYEYKRDKPLRDEEAKRKKEFDELTAKVALYNAENAEKAVQYGLIDPDDLGIKVKEIDMAGYGPVEVLDYTTARPLTANEKSRIRQHEINQDYYRRRDETAKEFQRRSAEIDRTRQELDRNQALDQAARKQTNPYTGQPYNNRFEKSAVEDRLYREGRTASGVIEDRERSMASVIRIAKEAKDRKAYEKEQAEYEERMKVASKKASEERRYERLRFQTAEKKKGYLGYLAGGFADAYGGAASSVVESTPAQALGQSTYGLLEIGYGIGVGTLGALSSAAVGLGTLGYRAAQYQGDLLQGAAGLQPRSKLEDDPLAQGGIELTTDLAKSAFAAYGTIGTGFDRLGRALSFDKETMAETGESPAAKRERQQIKEYDTKTRYVPILDTITRAISDGEYRFRQPTLEEIFTLRNEAAMARIPAPAIPFVGKLADATTDILRSVDRPIFSIDDAILKPAGKALASGGGAKVSLPRPLAGQLLPEQQLANIARSEAASVPRSPTFGQRAMDAIRATDRRIARNAAEEAIDVRTGTQRLLNPKTGKVERVLDDFVDIYRRNPDEYYRMQADARARVFGKKFQRDNQQLRERTQSVVSRAQDSRATNIFEELDVEESFVDGLSPMQQSIIRNNRATSPVVSQTPSVAGSTPKQPTPTPMQQAIIDAMQLSDEQLGVTVTDITQRQNIRPSLENIATREMLEKEATRRRMSGVSSRPATPAAPAAPAAAAAPKPAAAVAPKPAAVATSYKPSKAELSVLRQKLYELPGDTRLSREAGTWVGKRGTPELGLGPSQVTGFKGSIRPTGRNLEEYTANSLKIQKWLYENAPGQFKSYEDFFRFYAPTGSRREISALAKRMEQELAGSYDTGFKYVNDEGILSEEFASGISGRFDLSTGSKEVQDKLMGISPIGSRKTIDAGVDTRAMGIVKRNLDDISPTASPQGRRDQTYGRGLSELVQSRATAMREKLSKLTPSSDEYSSLAKKLAEEEERIRARVAEIIPEYRKSGGLIYDRDRVPDRSTTTRFYNGGMVRGQSGIDNVNAQLTAGEFVVNNKDTPKNIEALRYINNGGVIKPQRMYEGGEFGTQTSSTSSSSSINNPFGAYTISLEDKSQTFMETFVSQLNTFGKDFNSYVTQLSQIKIPDKIEMVGRHSVEVNVNGAAAFEAIEDGVRSLINTEIGKKMNMLWNQSNGQLGESIPTGDFNTGSTASQV